MSNLLLVNDTGDLTRVAIIENGVLAEVHIESLTDRRIVGNIYKGRVIRVLPGMNAAFVDVGLERTSFLYAYDVVTPRSPDDENLDDGPTVARIDGRGDSRDIHIESLLREGQQILVQVAKEPIGSKGARLTCNLTLPGVGAVLLPGVDHVGVSRRIEDSTERSRLREIGARIRPANAGIILRTNAEGHTEEELQQEVTFLTSLWEQIKSGADHVDAPTLIHEDMGLLLRTARDLICRPFDRLIIDSEPSARQLKSFVRQFRPALADRIEVHQGTVPLFEAHGIESEISRALQRKVWLKSGGTIVIERTEALTAIDVNSGKYTGKQDPDETILKTNLEAAKEIAYQLRLRNIGGIIVVDFIDMRSPEHQELVRSTLIDELKNDYARSRVLPMSELGLIQMTRKRVAESIVTRLTEPCFYCEGKGYLKSADMVAHTVMAKIRKELSEKRVRILHVHANPKVVKALTDIYLGSMERLEKQTGRRIELVEKDDFHLERTDIFGSV